ncbi:hypothetical protein E2F47_20805 [Mycobacterium eburneum]|nr:hypothetical protein [Mycobacterium eburneum]TDH49420.1 hypothetical protein E2F47_20805 [Mycobacterium eburneum]
MPDRPLLRGCAVVATAAALGAAGCSSPGATLERSPEVVVTALEAPLHDPVWSYRRHTLVGLTADHRVAEVANPARPDAIRTRVSAPMDAGRNLQISQKDDATVFVPRPQHGTVAVVDLASLTVLEEFDAGPAPAYLSEDAGQRVLLALAADGSSVTPVDQYGWKKLPTATIDGAPAEFIDGANRGRAIDYHLYGPSGIHYYKGPSSPPTERGSLAMDVVAAAGDGTKVTRSYVAARDQGVLYAVDSGRGGEGLEVVGTARLPSAPIRYLGTDDTRVYAATDHDVVVFEAASVTGYRQHTIPIVSVIDYRSGLPAGAKSAPLSGMAVGPHRVYLTLAGQAHLVSVTKPRL